MLDITDLAVKNLKAYMAENKVDSSVRIALMQGG
jgi:Fe-S cluster assembly iron-binding protein IscA